MAAGRRSAVDGNVKRLLFEFKGSLKVSQVRIKERSQQIYDSRLMIGRSLTHYTVR